MGCSRSSGWASLVAFAMAMSGYPANAADWPQWRGPDRDGVSRETGLLKVWPESGPKLLWQRDGIGKGMGSVAICDGRIYTLGLIDGRTRLIAVSERDGSPIWTADVGPGNPNGTPTVADGLVYAVGREGDLVCCNIFCGHGHNNGFPMCIEMATGKRTWEEQRGAGTGSAAIVYADGRLYFRYENGEMALVAAEPAGYRLVSQFTLASVKGKSWPHPVIAGGRLYIRDQESLLCYDVAR